MRRLLQTQDRQRRTFGVNARGPAFLARQPPASAPALNGASGVTS
jgi:hypothetical protein